MSSSSSSTEFDHLDLTLGPPHVPHQRRSSQSVRISSSPSSSAASSTNPIPIGLDLNLPLVAFRSPFDNDQWDIIKTLTNSDVTGHSRLLIAKSKANHIMKELSVDEQSEARGGDGLRVKVLDIDTNREVWMKLKVMASNQSHVLNGTWMSGFVNARGLKQGDVIGLRYWRQPREREWMILFKVLIRG